MSTNPAARCTEIKKKQPTAGHQLDVSSADESSLVDGLTADRDVLRLVEDHLAARLDDFTRAVVRHVGLDAQLLRLRNQRLPHGRLVAAPAAGEKPGELQRRRNKVKADALH